MSVQKKSLIGNRPAQKKDRTKAATEKVGESKVLKANALREAKMLKGTAATNALSMRRAINS